MELSDIHIKYNPDSFWAKRIKDIYRAGIERWNGLVLMGHPDLSGVLDVIAIFRGSEDLLMDLYDDPDEVKRIIRETEIARHEAYNDFAEVLKPQGGYTDVCGGYMGTERSFVVQCDFLYMIGNPMFKEFVLDTLKKDSQLITNIGYHLDGVGELNHLDDILSIDRFRCVQWVYGDGKPTAKYWLDVYKKIRAAGKEIQLNTVEDFDILGELHGSPLLVEKLPASERELALKIINAR